MRLKWQEILHFKIHEIASPLRGTVLYLTEKNTFFFFTLKITTLQTKEDNILSPSLSLLWCKNIKS